MFKARQQSSTSYPVLIYMVLSSDHVTPATGKTLTVTISKNGGSFASASGAVSELANGWYALAGNATDRNTLGTLAIRATATDCDDANLTIEIVPYDPFTKIDSNVTSMAANTLTASALAADAVAEIAAGMTATDLTELKRMIASIQRQNG